MYLNVFDGLWKVSYEEVQTSLPKDNRLYATTSELKLPRIMSLSTLDSEWNHPNYIAPAETTGRHKYHTSWHRPDELFRWVLESQEILLMYLALNHYVLSRSVMLPKSNWNNATILSLGLYNTAYPHVC